MEEFHDVPSWILAYDLPPNTYEIFTIFNLTTLEEIGMLWSKDVFAFDPIFESFTLTDSLQESFINALDGITTYLTQKKVNQLTLLDTELINWIEKYQFQVLIEKFQEKSISSLKELQLRSSSDETMMEELCQLLKPIPKRKFLQLMKEFKEKTDTPPSSSSTSMSPHSSSSAGAAAIIVGGGGKVSYSELKRTQTMFNTISDKCSLAFTDIPSWSRIHKVPPSVIELLKVHNLLTIEAIGRLWEEDASTFDRILQDIKIDPNLQILLVEALDAAELYSTMKKKQTENLRSPELSEWFIQNQIPYEVIVDLEKLNICSIDELVKLSEEIIQRISDLLKPIPRKKFLSALKELKEKPVSALSAVKFVGGVMSKSLDSPPPPPTTEPVPVVVPVVGITWICNLCKKVNKEENSKCGDCFYAKNFEAIPLTTPAKSLASITWECTVCKKKNDDSVKKCLDCFLPRAKPATPSAATSATPATGTKLNSCKKCKGLTVKKFFCENCVKAHETKTGKPFSGYCNNCKKCKDQTLNDEYCDACDPVKPPLPPPPPAPAPSITPKNTCKRCKCLTVKKFFCEGCIKAHEIKTGKPFTGYCNNCKDCKDQTLNDDYCDSCLEKRKRPSRGPLSTPATTSTTPSTSTSTSTPTTSKLNSCKQCKGLTTKRFFCESCIKKHERKTGKPFDGICKNCLDCKDRTLNDDYCDSCLEKRGSTYH